MRETPIEVRFGRIVVLPLFANAWLVNDAFGGPVPMVGN